MHLMHDWPPFTEDHHTVSTGLSSRPVSVGSVPRPAKPEHPELPFEAAKLTPAGSAEEPGADAEAVPRKMGRPRKWATEAERKRAYRERLAADLAEPERLRRELRNAKRRVADRDRRVDQVERDLARAEAEIERRSRRETELEHTVERLEAKVDDWRSRANALAKNLEAERVKAALLSTMPPASESPPNCPKPPPKRSPTKKPKRRKRR